MRILHLTDLHLQVEHKDRLDRLWLGALRQIEQLGPIAFVVISGDVAHTAREEEYHLALWFLEHCIDPLVGGKRERVIIVPGNHDVDWEKPIGPDVKGAGLRNKKRNFLEHWETSSYRFPRNDTGGLGDGFAIERGQYRLRFENFQHFLDAYYGRLPAPHRTFALLTESDHSHWSAHVFEAEGIAFYGINTCSHTDRFAQGVHLGSDLLGALGKRIKAKPDLIKVGVWHHGLVAERGQRDFLCVKDLAALLNLQLSFGMHGHTHADDHADAWDRFRERLPILATGAFGSEELPAAKGNQFTVLDVDAGYVHRRTYSFEQNHVWKPIDTLEKRFCLGSTPSPPLQPASPPPSPRTRAARHGRHIVVDESGIATLTVTLDGLEQVGALPLASLTPGYNNVKEGSLEVKCGDEERASAAGVTRLDGEFWLISQNPGAYDHIAWSCRFSNGYALDDLDAQCGVSRSAAALKLGPGEDAVVHQAAFDVDHLTISIALPAALAKAPKAFAHRQDGSNWVDEASVSGRLTLEQEHGTQPNGTSYSKLTLHVDAPATGHRYGFRYKLAAQKAAPSARCLDFLDALIKECRGRRVRPNEQALSAVLTEKISDLCARVLLNQDDDDDLFFVARLWSARRRRLLPAFGNFAPETWAASFGYGAGIAGHAYRFRSGSCWKQVNTTEGGNAAAELIFQQRDGGAEPDRRWILELPLFLCEGLAIGTIGFAAPNGDGTELSALDSLAEQRAFDDPKARARLDLFAEMASAAFWSITGRTWDYAAGVFQEHWQALNTG